MDIDKELKEAESLVLRLRETKRQQMEQYLKARYPNGNCSNCLHSVITSCFDIHEECYMGMCMLCRGEEICDEYVQCSIPEKRKFIHDIYDTDLTLEDLNKFNLDDLEKLYKLLSKYIEN